jgi:hypothetical protein
VAALFQCVKEHPRLFLGLFLIPLVFHVAILQISVLEIAAKSFEAWIPFIPLRVCLAIEGTIVGGAGGLASVLVAILLFNIGRSSLSLGNHPILYSVGWHVPFCFFSLFAFAMANDCYPPRQIDQALAAGLPISVVSGCIAGFLGAFILGIIPDILEYLASL